MRKWSIMIYCVSAEHCSSNGEFIILYSMWCGVCFYKNFYWRFYLSAIVSDVYVDVEQNSDSPPSSHRSIRTTRHNAMRYTRSYTATDPLQLLLWEWEWIFPQLMQGRQLYWIIAQFVCNELHSASCVFFSRSLIWCGEREREREGAKNWEEKWPQLERVGKRSWSNASKHCGSSIQTQKIYRGIKWSECNIASWSQS